MAGEVRFHELASAEYEAAFEWYFARSEFVASQFAEEMSRAVDMISAAPVRWPAVNRGLRKFVLRRFPFAIVYRPSVSTIQIVAIAHGSRRPGYWKGRL